MVPTESPLVLQKVIVKTTCRAICDAKVGIRTTRGVIHAYLSWSLLAKEATVHMPNEDILCCPLLLVMPSGMYKSDWPTASYLQRYICPAGKNQWLPFDGYSFMAVKCPNRRMNKCLTSFIVGLTNMPLFGKVCQHTDFWLSGAGLHCRLVILFKSWQPQRSCWDGRSRWEPTLQCNRRRCLIFSPWLKIGIIYRWRNSIVNPLEYTSFALSHQYIQFLP